MTYAKGADGDGLVGQLAAAWAPEIWRELNVVVAVSGGADSVALLRALVEIKSRSTGSGRLIVGHFNHRQRGAESDSDEAAVRQLSDALGVEFQSGAAAGPVDSEEAARDARYEFLRDLAGKTGARYVATAHTRDDQIETILHRIFRGAGLSGLAGIPTTRPLAEGITLVRPLLGCNRAEVLTYLDGMGQPFRHDATNDDRRFTRNWIRHELAPLLEEGFGADVGAAIASLGEQAEEAQAWIGGQAGGLASAAFEIHPAGASVVIDNAGLEGWPPLLIREACRLAWRRAGWPEQAMGRAQWLQLEGHLLAAPAPAPIMLPGGVRVERRDGATVLERAC